MSLPGINISSMDPPIEIIDPFVVIDNTPMTQTQAQHYIETYFGIFFANFKKEITKPIKEIEIWEIFKIPIANSSNKTSKIYLNSESIREFVSFIIYKKLNQYKGPEEKNKREDKDEYINHLYKLLFIIPSSYRFIIRRKQQLMPFMSRRDLKNLRKPKGPYTPVDCQVTNYLNGIPIKLSHLDNSAFFDEIISEMEESITEICKSDTLADVRWFIQDVLMGFSEGIVDLHVGEHGESYKDHFIEVFCRPVLKLFNYAYCESLSHYRGTFQKSKGTHYTSMEEDIAIKPAFSIYGGKTGLHHLLITLKRVRDYEKDRYDSNKRILKFATNEKLIREVLSNMFISSQKYSVLSNIEATVFYKLSINDHDKVLKLEYSTIKNCLFDFEHYSSATQNYLETPTLLASILFDPLLIDDDFDRHETEMGEFFTYLRYSEDEIEQQKKHALLSDEIKLWSKKLSERYNVNSSLIQDLNWNFVEIKEPDENWYSIMKSSENGKFISNILEITKETFMEIFIPNSSEIKLLNQSPGNTIILKLFDNKAISEFFYYDNKYRDSYNSLEIFRKHIIGKYYRGEVNINKTILDHNLSDKSLKVHSPKMIKYGALYQKGKWEARYIAFEKTHQYKEDPQTSCEK